MNYLITGGAGFIGSNIAEELVNQGEHVTVIDNLCTGNIENIQPFLNKIRFVNGSIGDIDLLNKEFENIDFVIHCAAIPSVPRSIKDPIQVNDINIKGTLNVLMAAKNAGVKRVIYPSSSSAYGNNPVSPKKETMVPSPLSPYAVTKLTGEYYCKVFSDIYGLETVVIRYFNVFGPKQDMHSAYSAVIPLFISKILKGERPTIFGDGLTSRDFTFIKNVVNANLLACKTKNVSGKLFNIACGDRINLNELVNKINNLLGTNIEPIHAEERAGDVRHSQADITKAKEELGYSVEVNFEEGLKKTIDWFRKKVQ